jgi:site-specific DNA recombinase
MPTLNGHGPRTAILYARVSTDEQARSGYSLVQQIEALRAYAAREGYEVLEEVQDPGQSGASLERPGMDRVRDLVAGGGVSVVLAQDRDRIAREPAYHYLLRKEFEEHGAKVRALNDRGDESPEGELTDGILDQLAKYERAKLGERTRRGKLRKVREGKLLRNSQAHYGFSYDARGEAYLVSEDDMRVVRRIFREISEGQSLHGMKRALEAEGVPAPAGGRYWSPSFLRTLILEDVYRPYTFEEVRESVTPEVAAKLDPSKSYGIFWSNRTRRMRKRISEPGPDGREYRWRHHVQKNPHEQWIAIPIPDAGMPRAIVDAARDIVSSNRQYVNKGRYFFELGGMLHCGACGKKMQYYASLSKGHLYPYYKCRRVVRDGKDACPVGRSRPMHRAEKLEHSVWESVAGFMQDPDQLREDLERMAELEREGHHGDPEREAEAWHHKLTEAEHMRSGYQDLAAKGLMTADELAQKLEALEITRQTAEQELSRLRNRRSYLEQLEQDKEAILCYYSDMAPEVLDALSSEERCQLYKMLRLKVIVYPDGPLEITGAAAQAFVSAKTSPR